MSVGAPKGWNWADQAANPRRPCPAATLFSAADGPVLPLSFSLNPDRGHAHSGGARRRLMAARILLTSRFSTFSSWDFVGAPAVSDSSTAVSTAWASSRQELSDAPPVLCVSTAALMASPLTVPRPEVIHTRLTHRGPNSAPATNLRRTAVRYRSDACLVKIERGMRALRRYAICHLPTRARYRPPR